MGISHTKRLSQRHLLPTAVKARQLSQETFGNSAVTSGSFSIADGVRVTITSTLEAVENPTFRLAAVPFMLAFFETSRTAALLIPFGASIPSNDYLVEGPIAMPALSGIGHDNSNLVFKTAITNNSGDTQTILFDIQVRAIIAGGGSV